MAINKRKFLETGRISTVIRQPLRSKFLKETAKGKLLNDLLERYYSGS